MRFRSAVAVIAHSQQAIAHTDTERSVTILPVGSKGATPMRRNRPGQLEGIISDYSKNTITFALVRDNPFATVFFRTCVASCSAELTQCTYGMTYSTSYGHVARAAASPCLHA